MFSLIILNFKRPDNVIKIINNIKTFKYIDEIIVSNGKLDTAIRLNDEKIVIYDDYNTINNIYSLDRRFICGLRAKNDNIIIIDDDIYITEDELYKLVTEYNKNTKRIVGKWGRNLNKGEYEYKDINGETDIVLTKLLICKRNLCSLFFICKPLIETIYKNGVPYGNGEDIFFSFIVSIYYNNKHYCNTDINAKELPQMAVAVGSNPGHLNYRRTLCKYLYENKDMFKSFISTLRYSID
jgi:hypothetical protein